MTPTITPLTEVLRSPNMIRLLTLSVAARAPQAVLGLLFLLQARDSQGSFAAGGLNAAAAAVGFAVGSPLLGRIIDRVGMTRVLVLSASLSSAAMGAAGAIDRPPVATLVVLALVAGAAQPPIAGSFRTIISRRTFDAHVEHAAIALHAATQELSLVLGPLLLVTWIGAQDAGRGLIAGAALMLLASMAYALTPAVRRDGAAHPAGMRESPVRSREIRGLLFLGFLTGCTFGTIEIATAASADSKAMLGILLGVYSTASVVAGMIAAARPARRLLRRLRVWFVIGAASQALLAILSGSQASLAVALVVAGATAAPTLTLLYVLAGRLAGVTTTTEAFTWLGSALFAGAAMGSAAGGVVVTVVNAPAAFALGAGCFGIAAARIRVGQQDCR